MEFLFFEIQIWYAWLELHKNWMLIMQDKKYQSYYILCKIIFKDKIGWTVESCQVGYDA